MSFTPKSHPFAPNLLAKWRQCPILRTTKENRLAIPNHLLFLAFKVLL
jgi:hypothetical protein